MVGLWGPGPSLLVLTRRHNKAGKEERGRERRSRGAISQISTGLSVDFLTALLNRSHSHYYLKAGKPPRKALSCSFCRRSWSRGQRAGSLTGMVHTSCFLPFIRWTLPVTTYQADVGSRTQGFLQAARTPQPSLLPRSRAPGQPQPVSCSMHSFPSWPLELAQGAHPTPAAQPWLPAAHVALQGSPCPG